MDDKNTPQSPEIEGATVIDLDAQRAKKEAAADSGKKKKDPPIETFWTKELMRRGDYASYKDAAGRSILYNFQRDIRTWVIAEEENLYSDVTKFLTVFKADKYSNSALENCVKITDSYTYTFGQKLKDNGDFIISTISHFLHVQDDGKIVALDKDELGAACKQYFCKLHINVDLRGTGRVGCYYVPQKTDDIEKKDSHWAKMVTRAFVKKDNRRCFQEFFGDTLNPTVRKAFPVLVGDPDGGKSKLLEVLKELHGNTGTSIDLEDLGGFETEKLLGATFVAVDEIGKQFSEKHFKRMIGGSSFEIKRKFMKNLSVKPNWKSFGADNFTFNFSEKSGALETRFFYIKADTVKEELRVDDIAPKAIKHDLMDILDWALNGAVEVVKRGRLMRHSELPADSQKIMHDMKKKTNPCVAFLKDIGAKFSEHSLLPKQDLYKHFVQHCLENGRAGMAKVSFEVWCRDFFAKAIKDVDGEYDAAFERRASVRVNGASKRVECFPLYLTNSPEYSGKEVGADEARRTHGDKDAYINEVLPAHILEKLEAEARELQAALSLSEEQRKAYMRKKLLDQGYVELSDGSFEKVVGGSGEINF